MSVNQYEGAIVARTLAGLQMLGPETREFLLRLQYFFEVELPAERRRESELAEQNSKLKRQLEELQIRYEFQGDKEQIVVCWLEPSGHRLTIETPADRIGALGVTEEWRTKP